MKYNYGENKKLSNKIRSLFEKMTKNNIIREIRTQDMFNKRSQTSQGTRKKILNFKNKVYLF